MATEAKDIAAALLELGLVDLVAAKLAAHTAAAAPSPPRYADGDNNPMGSARAFLDAGRRGDFPTFRVARKVTALWSDVLASIEAKKKISARASASAASSPAGRTPPTPSASTPEELDEMLEDMKERRRPRRPKAAA
jgi:hypothetical protein